MVLPTHLSTLLAIPSNSIVVYITTEYYMWCRYSVPVHVIHILEDSGTAAHPVVCWWSTVITDISMILVL